MKKRFKKVFHEFIKIIKASRITRSSYAILSILTAASFVNKINLNVIVFICLSIMFYSIGGLHNAIKDNDYKINRSYFYTISIVIIIAGLFLASINKKIYYIIPVILALTYFYNTKSRKIIFSDVLTTSLTHIFIPFLGTIWILNKNPLNYLIYAIFLTICYFFIINVKNIVGYKEDKKRGYITPMTFFKHGRTIIKISVILGIITILIYSFILNLYTKNIIIILSIFILNFFIIKNITLLNGKNSLSLGRLVIIIIFIGILFQNHSLISIYFLFLLFGSIFIKEGMSVLIKDIKIHMLPLKSEHL